MPRKPIPPRPPVPKEFSIDWPPGFKSALVVDPRTRKFETDWAKAQRNRTNGGWDSHPVGLAKTPINDAPKMMRKP